MTNFNFTLTWASLILFIATIPEFGATFISFKGYLAKRYPYFAYMTITWASLGIGNLLIAKSYLTLDPIIYRVGIVGTAPLLFAIMLLVDWVSRESVDPRKLFIVTVISSCLFIFAFDTDSVNLQNSLIGELGPAMAGRFSMTGSIVFILAGLMWLFYMAKINMNSPRNIKFYSRINLIGAILAGPGSMAIFATGIVWILPGTDYFFIGLGALFCAIAFTKEPRLGYVLPFKVYRMQTIDIKSGILVHSYSWDEKGLGDSELFSGALTGISALLQETLGRGLIREISFENGILILLHPKGSPLAHVLISSKSSPILKRALEIYAHAFEGKFESLIKTQSFHNVGDYKSADELIKSSFPFVVAYA